MLSLVYLIEKIARNAIKHVLQSLYHNDEEKCINMLKSLKIYHIYIV